MMYNMDYTPYLLDDCPTVLSDHTDNDKSIDEKIKNAESMEELVGIFSDELVKSIKDQLHL